jgi:hypothetical protein
MTKEHDRIWLEPIELADEIEGRMWCQDNQWGEKGVEYIRADLISALTNTSGADEAPVAWVYPETLEHILSRKDRFEQHTLSLDKVGKFTSPLYARPQSAAVRDEETPHVHLLVGGDRALLEAVRDLIEPLTMTARNIWVSVEDMRKARVVHTKIRAALHSTQEG